MNLFSTVRIVGVGALLAIAGTAVAQNNSGSAPAPAAPAAAPNTPTAAPTFRTTGIPGRDTLLRMQKTITVDFNEQPLQKVMDYIRDTTGARIDVLWKTDKEDGWDKEHLITLSATDMPALTFLERLLLKMDAETGNAASWQLTDMGTMQVGTKERLNKFKRIEIYDINDLLFVMPVYDQAPTIDLQQVLQSSGQGGGGSSRSPFTNNQNRNQNRENEKPKEDRATDLIALIGQLVESDQWVETGGSGGTMKYYMGSLIVNAPDYMHRALNGYPWWPSTRTTVTTGKRYVAMNIDTGVSKLERFEGIPIPAVVGGSTPGGGGGGGGAGGGGGSKKP